MTRVEITGEVFEWRGPAPYYFLAVPEGPSARLRAVASRVSYGWGMIPVTVTVGDVVWTTALWPKDGGYVVPLKVAPRRRIGVELGDVLTAVLTTDEANDTGTLSREELVELVRRVRAGEAQTEEQEEGWLADIARSVPHPRAIDLVLYPEVEVGEDAGAGEIVDVALGYRG